MSDFGFVSVNYPHYPLSTFIVLFGLIFSITPILLLLIPYRLIRLVNLSYLVVILVAVLVLDMMRSPGNAEWPVQGPSLDHSRWNIKSV